MLARLHSLFKQFLKTLQRQDVFMILLIIVVGVASFGLGRLSLEDTQSSVSPVNLENILETYISTEDTPSTSAEKTATSQQENTTQRAFVGSKNSDKYHYPWCPGALQMKEENKVWFTSREEAESSGYTPAGNCKGL